MALPPDWNWVEHSRPYALRRAFNACVERNVYEPPDGHITPGQLEEQYPIVEEAVSRAERELWESASVWTNEDQYRRFLGNRADWRARDLCDRHQRPVSEDASSPRGLLPAGWRLDFEDAFHKLSPLQQRIIRLRYSCHPHSTDRELTEALQRSGEVDEKGRPIPRWRITRERMRAEALLERSLGLEWKQYTILYCNIEDAQTED